MAQCPPGSPIFRKRRYVSPTDESNVRKIAKSHCIPNSLRIVSKCVDFGRIVQRRKDSASPPLSRKKCRNRGSQSGLRIPLISEDSGLDFFRCHSCPSRSAVEES